MNTKNSLLWVEILDDSCWWIMIHLPRYLRMDEGETFRTHRRQPQSGWEINSGLVDNPTRLADQTGPGPFTPCRSREGTPGSFEKRRYAVLIKLKIRKIICKPYARRSNLQRKTYYWWSGCSWRHFLGRMVSMECLRCLLLSIVEFRRIGDCKRYKKFGRHNIKDKRICHLNFLFSDLFDSQLDASMISSWRCCFVLAAKARRRGFNFNNSI